MPLNNNIKGILGKLVLNILRKIRMYFHPNCIIKVKALDNKWHDRDEVMFHAVFQILVDFVELEQPFTFPESVSGRMTDKSKMLNGIDAFGKEQHDCADTIDFLKELYFLYDWYTNKGFEFPYETRSKAITNAEWYEMEGEHDLLCDVMIVRVIKIRHYLWT